MDKGFTNLLRHSRLSSLPKAVKMETNLRATPKQQVIHTTPASFHRHDFGLKRTMPARMKSPYITLNALDTYEGMTDFERGSSYYLKHKRSQELGIAPSTENIDMRLFASQSNSSKSWKNLTKKDVQELIKSFKGDRLELMKWGAENNLKNLPFKERFLPILESYFKIRNGTTNINNAINTPVKGNAGFSYLLSGGFHNAPIKSNQKAGDGITFAQATNIVKGREVAGLEKSTSAAVGGFVARYNSPSRTIIDSSISEKPIDVVVTNISIRSSGSVELIALSHSTKLSSKNSQFTAPESS